jgi:23S rRNA pseudouridine1911/1915/1917 synthase
VQDNKVSELETGERVISFSVSEEQASERVDSFIAKATGGDTSRSRAQALIEEGRVTVNGKIASKSSLKVKPGDLIVVSIPPRASTEVKGEEIPIDIVYEDKDVIVVNKPRGMVVHPAAGHWEGTLVNAILGYCPQVGSMGVENRPGIVHRLDKDTTGLLIVAKNERTLKALQNQMKARVVRREYIALCQGFFGEDRGTVNAPIGRHPADRKRMAVIKPTPSENNSTKKAREALTDWLVLTRFGCDYSLVKASLHTGRTHQIRVHMAYIGHPILGDPVYGGKARIAGLQGQALHAFKLGVFLGDNYDEYHEFFGPLPDDFAQILLRLEDEYGEEIPSWLKTN